MATGLRHPRSAGASFLSVVAPAHNEEMYLEAAVSRIVDGLHAREWPFEVLICENGSTDRTREIAAALARTLPEVRALQLPAANYGLALKAGFEAARGDVVVNFDVDLVDLGFLDRAMELMTEEDDIGIVVGTKRGAGAEDERAIGRRLVTGGFSMVLRYGFGLHATDTHGLKALRRAPVAPLVSVCSSGSDIFDTELVLRAERAGLRVAEIPVRVVEERPARTPIGSRIPRTLAGLGLLRLSLWRARTVTPALLPGPAAPRRSPRAALPRARAEDDEPARLVSSENDETASRGDRGALLASPSMESGETSTDDLAVRLRWPESQSEPIAGDPPSEQEPVAAAPPPEQQDLRVYPPGGPPPESGNLPSTIPGLSDSRTDALMTALTTLAFRVDALSATTTAFRTLINDRLSDQTDKMGRAYASIARDVDEHRRAQDRSLGHLDEALRETDVALTRVERINAQITTRLEAAMTATADLGRRLHETIGRQAQLHAEHLTEVATTQTEGFERLALAVDRLEARTQSLDHLGADQSANRELIERAIADSSTLRTDVETSLARTRDALRNQVERIDGEQSARASRISERIDRLVIEVADNVDGAVAGLEATMTGRLAELGAKLTELETARRAEITAIAERLTSRAEAIETKLAGADGARIDAVGTLATELSTRLARTDEHVTAEVERVAADLPDRFGRLERALAASQVPRELEGTLAALPEQLAVLGTDQVDYADQLHERLDQLTARLEQTQSAQADRLAALGTAQGEQREALTALVTEMLDKWSAAQGRAATRGSAAITKELERLAAAVDALAERPDSAAPGRDQDIERLETSIATLTAGVDALRRRIALRARPEPAIDEATIAAVADAVAARLAGKSRSQGRAGPR
jgi:hypothetical protein